MSEYFDASAFSGCVGDSFRLLCDDGSILDLELVEVTPDSVHPSDAKRQREPFSIVFRGPVEPLLPQRIYRFEHDELGSFELFIVAIGPDEGRMQYEAVFS